MTLSFLVKTRINRQDIFMRNIEKIVRTIIISLASIMFGCLAIAAINEDESKYFKGSMYAYEKVPVYENDSREIAFYGGIIRVLDSNSGIVYQHHTNYMPGCNGLPAVSMISLNVKKLPNP